MSYMCITFYLAKIKRCFIPEPQSDTFCIYYKYDDYLHIFSPSLNSKVSADS